MSFAAILMVNTALYLSLLWLLLATHFDAASYCIYGLGGGHTHTHIHTHTHTLWRNESDFKKPGAPGLKSIVVTYVGVLSNKK